MLNDLCGHQELGLANTNYLMVQYTKGKYIQAFHC